MMGQISLFDVIVETEISHDGALSHPVDLKTSDKPTEKLTRSGKPVGQRKSIVHAPRQCDGVIHAELGQGTGVQWLILARHLPELEQVGLVRKGAPLAGQTKGPLCTTWSASHWECSR